MQRMNGPKDIQQLLSKLVWQMTALGLFGAFLFFGAVGFAEEMNLTQKTAAYHAESLQLSSQSSSSSAVNQETLHPSFPPLTTDSLTLGFAAYTRHEYPAALKYFQTALQQIGSQSLSREIAKTYYGLAITYAKLQQYEAAENYYSRVIARYPNESAAALATQGLAKLPVYQPTSVAIETHPAGPEPPESSSAVAVASAQKTVSPQQGQKQEAPSKRKNDKTDDLNPDDLNPKERALLKELLQAYSEGALSRTSPPTLNSANSVPQPQLQNYAQNTSGNSLSNQSANPSSNTMQPPAMDPNTLMMMQALMGGGNNNNNNFNPMSMMMMAPGATNGSLPGAGVDPSVMSQMLVNQMMGSFSMDSGKDDN